jgi:hypothetical protein
VTVNGEDGISGRGTFIGNSIHSNLMFGLDLTSSSAFAHNVLTGNTNDFNSAATQVSASTAQALQTAGNACNGSPCP